MKAIMLAMVGCLLCGCGAAVDDGEARRAVESLGFDDVRVLDKSIVTHGIDGCGKNPRGVVTTVTVCCGFPFKGCTVRH